MTSSTTSMMAPSSTRTSRYTEWADMRARPNRLSTIPVPANGYSLASMAYHGNMVPDPTPMSIDLTEELTVCQPTVQVSMRRDELRRSIRWKHDTLRQTATTAIPTHSAAAASQRTAI